MCIYIYIYTIFSQSLGEELGLEVVSELEHDRLCYARLYHAIL